MSVSRPWTPTELAVLRNLYPDLRAQALADALGRSLRSVHAQAAKLGLSKSAEFLASPQSGRTDGTRGAAGRFQPGHATWNRGRSFQAGGRSVETRFRPGRPACEARNYVPIGSLRVSADGLLERKVTDDRSLVPARRWVGVHRLVWEAAHGPIPPGHAVVFKPGRRTAVEAEITVDALELVSRVELMRRNSVQRLPKELARLVQLRSAITRQINKRSREA